MKILFYGINFYPELTGVGKYSGEMATWLAERGHKVRVVTAPPYYPQWQISKGYSNSYSTQQKQVFNSNESNPNTPIKIFRCPLWLPKKKSGLLRLLHLASFSASSLPLALANALWKPDVILMVAPTLLCAFNAFTAARIGNSKTCLHIQDFELDAAMELGLLNLGKLQHCFKKLESRLIGLFDRVSTISEKMIERLKDRNIRSDNHIFFPNWVDTDLIYPMINSKPFYKELSLPATSKVALYSGNMNFKQGLGILAECARLLSDRNNLTFVFCGAGPARKDLEDRTRHLPNVRFLPLQPIERLNDLLNLADIHLLPQKVGAADLVMPSKLTGMLASGRPVVATAEPGTQVAQIVGTCGRVVPPGDAKKMATGIEWLLENENEAKALGKAGRKYAINNWSKEPVLRQFEHDLINLCQA